MTSPLPRRRVLASLAVALVALLAIVLVPASLVAEIKLPAVIGDNMVLQRDQLIPIWGWTAPGRKVTVTVQGASATATAGDDGKWSANLPAMKAGGPHEMTIAAADSDKVTLKNILVGEVWICSGQSNMEWTVSRSNNPKEEIAAGEHPRIRHIKLRHRQAEKPVSDVPSPKGWELCSPQTVANFTAVGYYFGRHLQKNLDVPIGLIGTNWGGTRIEPWTPPVGFQSVPALKDIASKLDEFPKKNKNGKVHHQSPLALYNGMIHPLVPYAVRGAIWYQGESNNGEGMTYFEKMKALVNGWRSVWKRPDMPFYFVQLAPFNYRGNPLNLPGIWEAQTAALSIPNTGMAVTVDIGNTRDIHPRNKQDVGKRLALWALAKDYGKKDLVYSGPLYKGMKVDGKKAIISFDHVGGGLVARDGKPLSWFSIAGADKKFVEAKAEIRGNSVVVHADGVEKPAAVRFGWHQNAEPNLSNKAGLPASPFRTDRW